LENTVTIVLDGSALLSAVCGANDANLKAIETALGKPVYARGNELCAKGLSETEAACFQSVVDALVRQAKSGNTPAPDFVSAAFQVAGLVDAGVANTADAMEDALITVPHGFVKVYPKTANQLSYIEKLRTHEITFCTGPAGTGKTYIAIAYALQLVLTKKMRRLVLTRPVVEAGESLGFLPGDLTQKINPYLRPLYDAMESIIPFNIIQRLEETHAIEIAPLAYMRGRSLNDAVVILDEAQNTTREQMKMFLTRLGMHSKAIITGDTTQIDLPKRSHAQIESGLLHALAILGPSAKCYVKELGFQDFNKADVVRNPIIKKIIAAYEAEG
jgi:phosphate starvation-inducible PhoH-like protein